MFLVLYDSPSVHAANPVKVDVLYMNHGPLRDTLKEIKGVFSGYGDKITVSWHDFETEEGDIHGQEGDQAACAPGHLDRR